MTPTQATWRGAVTALVVALPVAVFNQLLIAAGDIESASPVTVLFWLLILFGAAAGGWGVLRLAPDAGLPHAAAAGALAYAVVQGVGIIRRLLADEPLSWLAFPFLALLMATAAMVGGMIARRWNAQAGELGDASDAR
jgi:predicted permease